MESGGVPESDHDLFGTAVTEIFFTFWGLQQIGLEIVTMGLQDPGDVQGRVRIESNEEFSRVGPDEAELGLGDGPAHGGDVAAAKIRLEGIHGAFRDDGMGGAPEPFLEDDGGRYTRGPGS